ncbi:MAG: hypothetical protein ACTSWW_11325, partial [Promethearchaeota archaeon]
WIHEYYLKASTGTKWKSRILFRELKNIWREKKALDILESGNYNVNDLFDEEPEFLKQMIPVGEGGFGPSESGWVCIKPLDQLPYVLSDRAVKKGWIPPVHVSALPQYIRRKIPKEFQYWKADTLKKALEMRDELVKAMKKGEIEVPEFQKKVIQKFTLAYQTWKKTFVIRFGPTDFQWNLYLDPGSGPLTFWRLKDNPIEQNLGHGYLKKEPWREAMTFEGDAQPGHPLNPKTKERKETPSKVKILDRGTVIVLEDGSDFKKYEFKGKQLQGLWIFKKENSVWGFKRSELPEVV